MRSNTVHKIKEFILLSVLLIPVITTAQEDDLPVEEVEVIKNFEARLAEADKLDVHPNFPPLDTTLASFDYTLGTYEPALEYIEPDIRPLAMSREQSLTAYDGHLKGGYGIPNQSYFRGGYHTEGKDGRILDIEARHQAAKDKSYDYKQYMENDLDLAFAFPLNDNSMLRTRAGYRLDQVYYYGYDHSDSTLNYSNEEAKKQFNEFRAGLGLENREMLRGDINYSAQLDFYQLKDDLATRENGFILDLSGEKYIAGTHPLRIQVVTDYTNLKDTLERKLNNFHLKPDFTWRGKYFRITGGLHLVSSDDDFFFFPTVEIQAELSGQRLIGFAGTKGNLFKNSYRGLSRYNPYLTERIDSLANSKHTDIYAGLSGRYRSLTYELSGAYKDVEHMALFLPKTDDRRKFATVFDELKITRIKASVAYDARESLRLMLEAKKNFYNTEREQKAWHLPTFELHVISTYISPDRSLRLKGGVSMKSGIHTLDEEGSEQKLDGIFNLNLGADYYFTDSFGLFVHLNNITAGKWERWDAYPSFGFNAVGGLQYRF